MGYKSIWLEIPTNKIPFLKMVMDDHGFEIHHARKDYFMLTKWLDESTPSKLPEYTTHYIGVGGLVLNENGHILMVKDKKKPHR